MMTNATQSTQDFQEIRATTIAAHESPALFETVADIAGVDEDEDEEFENQEGQAINAYGSPLSLWELKSGHYTTQTPQKRSLWSRIKWGICQDAIEELNLDGRKAEGVMISNVCPHMSSRVEMEVASQNEVWEPMIAKNVASTRVNMWRNSLGEWVVPEAIQLEAQHHLAVRGGQVCYIVAFMGGLSTRTFVVERDEEMCQELIETIQDFWSLVKTKTKPRANGQRDQAVLARLNATIDPKQTVVDMRGNVEFLELLAEKEKLKAIEKDTTAKLKKVDAQIKEQMDEIGSAIISDTHQLKWIKTKGGEVSYTKAPSAHLRTSKIDQKAAGTSLENLIDKS